MRHPFEGLFVLIIMVGFIALVVGVILNAFRKVIAETTIFEYQRGLLYRNGKFQRVLEAGKYTLIRMWDAVSVVDVRECLLTIVNQEVICADNLSLRISVAAVYKVVDPVLAIHSAQRYYDVLYMEMQMALREVLTGMTIEDVMSKRNELSASLLANLKEKAAKVGVDVTSCGIKDITMPADVKKIFSLVAQADKEGQAALARSRSEVAALRALANAAKMIDENPNLLSLRTLQSVNDVASGTGNTIVFGVPGVLPLGPGGKRPAPPPPPPPRRGEGPEE